MRLPIIAAVATTLSASTLAASLSEWQAVAAAGGERVEIDRGRIMRTGQDSAVAWTRLVLGRELADGGGNYTAVQAMNRYDCEARSFATLRRVYMNGDQAVREERIGSPREVAAVPGSVDARLLTAACRPRSASPVPSMIGDEATDRVAVAPEGKPGVMYADVRTAGEAPKVHTTPVADVGKPELKSETAAEPRPGSAAETRIEIRPPSERPRFIDLPKKDIAPATTSAPTPSAPAPAPAAGKADEAKRVTEAKSLAKSVEAVMSAQPVNRHERERMLATSGPRRAPVVVRQPAPEPQAVVDHRQIEWSYEGDGGPANWSRLRSDYGTCATGRRQSPIDIRDGIRVDLEAIKLDYRPTQFRIVDNGHTVQVYVGEGSTLTVMGRSYRLVEFHFHRPSTERVNGRVFDMVVHFTHRDDEGHVAKLAVLLEKGAENPLIQTLWNNMPLEVNQDVMPAVAIDLNTLLPESRAYYTYMGSLTMPPCTEDVLWMVFKQPMQVSAEQIGIFSRLYRNNARPVQPTNNRLIKENR